MPILKVLKFSISNIVEDESIPSPLLKKKTILRHLLFAIEKASNKKTHDIVLIKISSLENISWAIVQNIRRELLKLRNKPTIAYLDSGGMKEYYLASACEEIFLPPSATLNILGFKAEAFFFKQGLENIGIAADIVNTGDYKTFADMLTRDNMSKAHREMLHSILTDYLKEIENSIKTSRKNLEKLFSDLINEAPFTAEEALTHKLVDKLIYQEDINNELKKRFDKDKIRPIPLSLSRANRGKCYLNFSKKIAIIYAQGAIIDPPTKQEQQKYNIITHPQFIKALKTAKNNKRIKAIVIRINSPGGSALSSDIIWNEIKKTKTKKPIIVSMSDVAASGGYYIAMAADEIFAEPMTLTGSIGVISGKIYTSKLLEKLSINRDIVTLGENADIYSVVSPFSQKQREKIEKQTFDFYYKNFLNKAAEDRKMPIEDIKKVAQGRVWTGNEAEKHRLIDKTGGFIEAINRAKIKADIKDNEKIHYKILPKRKLSIAALFSDNFSSGYKEIAKLIENYKFFSKENFLYILPFNIKIN